MDKKHNGEEEQVKKFSRIYYSLMLSFLCLGCSSMASNRRACAEAGVLMPLPHSFLGAVFQLSPCTSIESLRIETGSEIDGLRESVLQAIQDKEMNGSIIKFSEKMGCKSDGFNRFFEVLILHEKEIFGQSNENSDRSSVGIVRSYTKLDTDLRKACWDK